MRGHGQSSRLGVAATKRRCDVRTDLQTSSTDAGTAIGRPATPPIDDGARLVGTIRAAATMAARSVERPLHVHICGVAAPSTIAAGVSAASRARAGVARASRARRCAIITTTRDAGPGAQRIDERAMTGSRRRR